MSTDAPALEPAVPPSIVIAAASPAVFTYTLIALLFAIFGVEVVLSLSHVGELLAPSLPTLYILGGVSRVAILDRGEWWRIFTGPLLHADLAHVGFNCLALFLVGRRLEPLIGWRWTAAIFAISAICGALVSLAVNPPNLVGVGASGGIVGIFAAAIFAVTRMPVGKARTRLITQASYGLVSAVLPFFQGGATAQGMLVDYGAHFGGALGGAAVSLLLIRLWPRGTAQPPRPKAALAVAAVYFAVAAISILPIAGLYSEQLQLAPNLPATTAELAGQIEELVRQYPHDPRVLMDQGAELLDQNQPAKAEASFRAGLGETAILHDVLDPVAENNLRVMLAVTLHIEGKDSEAKTVAAAVCGIETGQAADELKRDGLCP